VQEAETLVPEQRVFIQRIRRAEKIIDATADVVIQAGTWSQWQAGARCW